MSPVADILLRMAVTLAALMVFGPLLVWVERRLLGRFQLRRGPNRVGPFGLLQTVADAIKLLTKEDWIPPFADPVPYVVAPMILAITVLGSFAVVPFSDAGAIIDLNIGVLFFLAMSSVGVYSVMLAGVASNSKYSLLGAVRSAAQMISYELALGLSVVAVLIPVGSLRLDDVVDYQVQGAWLGFLPHWNVFPQALGFLVFLIAAFAETNRLPFDLPEAESELVGGYHTEYSSMKFALFFMGEYMAMATLSALAATLFFGGWHLPGLDYSWHWAVVGLVGFSVLMLKVSLFMFLFVWVRWTFPRFRFDQLLRLGWKVLLPLAIVNLVVTAALTIGGYL